MHIRKLLAVVLLGLSLSAAADFTTLTAAYEVSISDLRMPRSTGGTLTFRRCTECALETVRVNSKTRYVLNDRDVELKEFREELRRVRNKKMEGATVRHHLESNMITSVRVNL